MEDKNKEENEKKIRDFIARNSWREAKSYAKSAPHAYLVLEYLTKENQEFFIWFVKYIREFGNKERFFRTFFIYFYLDGYKYWTMGNPISDTNILNRAIAVK